MTESATLSPFKVLFVSEIDNYFEENSLWQVFAPWANKIRSICINRSGELRSRKSASAYINFFDHPNALNALKHIQPLFLGFSLCRVFPYDGNLYRKPPRPEHYGGCGLFVRNLDPAITIKMVFDLFSPYGTLQACRIATDDSRNSRGFAYVTYESSDAAQTALCETNGKALGSRTILVTENRPRAIKGHRLFVKFRQFTKLPSAETDLEEEVGTNCTTDGENSAKMSDTKMSESRTYETITEDDLRQVFQQFSSFDNLTFLHNTRPSNNRHGCRGYAFVTLLDLQEAEQAIASIKEIAGLPATVRFATSDQPNGFIRRPRTVAPTDELDQKTETVSPRLTKPSATNLVNEFTSESESSPVASDLAKLTLDSATPPNLNARSCDPRSPEDQYEADITKNEPKRAISETNLFVRPIPAHITESDLRQLFSPFGTLLSVRIMTDPNGESRGFGFVGYESSDSAARAAAELDGTELGRSVIQVSAAYTRRHLARRSPVRPNLFGTSPIPLSMGSSPVGVPGYYYVPVDYLPLDYAYSIPGASPVLSNAGLAPFSSPSYPGNYGSAGYAYPAATPPYTTAYQKSPYYQSSVSISPSPASSPPASESETGVWSTEQQALGETLHPVVLRHPRVGYAMKLANIVTGMLLSQPLENVNDWLQQPPMLDGVISQAVDAYLESAQK